MKIMLTGADGFIGKSVRDALEKRQVEVIPVGISFFANTGDVAKSALQNGMQEVDAILHLGAISDTLDKDINKIMKFNYFASKMIFDVAAEYNKRVVFASSASIYGDRYNIPGNLYAWSKMLAEDYGMNKEGLDFIGLRYFNCYDEKTEVLTEDGFKFLKDVEYSDKIATLNPSCDVVEYHNPSKIHQVKYNGKMIHFNGRRIDILCTPEQNIYVGKDLGRGKKKYRLREAQQIISDNEYASCLKTTAEWNGLLTKFEIIPSCSLEDGRQRKDHFEKKIPIKMWLSFLGWFLSEGSVFSGWQQRNKRSRYYRVNISQVKNLDYIEEIYHLVKDMGFNPQRVYRGNGKVASGITIHSKQLYLYLARFKTNKYIPRDILKLDRSLLIFLYESLMKGDGHKSLDRYTTKYKQLADDFQELLLKIAKVGRISGEQSKSGRSSIYRIHIPQNDHPQLGNCERKNINYSLVDFNDYVYDVTVRNHIMLMRRNGLVCWSGNCYGPGEEHKKRMASIAYQAYQEYHFHKVPFVLFQGKPKRDFIFVYDVVWATLHALSLPKGHKGCYEVGTGKARTFEDVLDCLGVPFTYYEDNSMIPIGYQYHTCSNRERWLPGWQPTFTLEQGLTSYKTYLEDL